MKTLILRTTILFMFCSVIFNNLSAQNRDLGFINKENAAANDLHIEFTNGNVTLVSKTYFNNHNPNGGKHDFTGGTVPIGDTVKLSFNLNAGGKIRIKAWWWTKDGNVLGKVKNPKDNGKENYFSCIGPATGNGIVSVSIGGLSSTFYTNAGYTESQTAASFLSFINTNFNSGSFDFIYTNQSSANQVFLGGNILGDSTKPFSVEIISEDQTQSLFMNDFDNISFTSQSSGTSSTLYSVSAVSGMIAWAGGAGATVRRTTDGGNIWMNATGSGISGDIYNIYGRDANTAFCTTTPSSTFIYKTSNGGTTWNQVYDQAVGFINAIQMVSATTGYALGDPVDGKWTVLKTTNSGNNWVRMLTEPNQIGTEAGWNNSFYILGTNMWFGTNSTRVYHSTDLGLTWIYGATTGTAYTFAVHYNSVTTGLAAGNAMVLSTNSGTTYSQVTSPGTTGSINGIEGSGRTWWSIRNGNRIYMSTNEGTNWTTAYAQTGTSFQDLDFTPVNNSAAGWVVGSLGAISKMTTITATDANLNLTGFIQGLYNASANTMLSDTAEVYLRNITSPYSLVDCAEGVLNSSGIGVFNFYDASIGGPYYIVLKHRSSIETWSSGGNSFSNLIMNYNFSTAQSKAFGNNMLQVDNSPLRYAVYSGDVSQDGIVDGSDLALINNDAANFALGYLATDLNGDQFVDGSDYLIADNNASNFVSMVRP